MNELGEATKMCVLLTFPVGINLIRIRQAEPVWLVLLNIFDSKFMIDGRILVIHDGICCSGIAFLFLELYVDE